VDSKVKDNLERKSIVRIYNKRVYENNSFFAKLAFKINRKLEVITKFLRKYYT